MATLLIVDDSLTVRAFLVAVLTSTGHRVLEAGDGAEALRIAQAERPDLVIADILMPTMDGYEFVRRLRADPAIAHTRVIFNTAHYHEQETQALARACGVSSVLTKTCDPQEVLQAVETALGVSPPPPNPPAPEEFDRDHRRLLTDKLSQKVNELTRLTERQTALIDLGLQLGSERDPRQLLQTFCHAAREIIGARSATTSIFSGAGPELRYFFTSGMDGETAQRVTALEPSSKMLRTILDERRCFRLHDSGGAPAALGLPSSFPAVHAWLGAPIISPARVYGWLSLFDKLGADEFSEEDERLAAILTAQVGRIYENGSLYADLLRQTAELHQEVIERKRLEDEVRQAQQSLQHVIDSSPAVLFTLTVEQPSLRPTWISENVRDLLGYTAEEALTTPWWQEHLHPEDRDEVVTKVQQDLFANGRVANEYRFRHRDEKYRWLRSEMRLLRDAAGNPCEIIGSWSDITERKLLEDQYRQAQKMEAVGRLAGGVAHDFNNLLTVIAGYSELLLGSVSPQDPTHEPLAEIQKAGQRAARLTRQLLAFSRKQILVPVLLNVNLVLAEMETMLSRLIGADIDLQFSAAPALRQVKIDPGMLEQALMNLVVNARDAMPGGGKLTIETANVDLDETYVRTHTDIQPGAYVLIAVSDTGCGMDAATQARLFEPFFTTKGPEKGTGLGLATAYGIVKTSGGRIDVYSELGAGSTFKVYLPRAIEALPLSKPAVPRPAPSQGAETLLLVEDEEGVRLLARLILESRGYKVIEARNGTEALRLCQENTETIHLLVTDIVMPFMSGRSLTEQLESRRPGLKVLYMSGYTDDAIVHHGVLDPGTAFLQKPFTAEALARKVRETLDEVPS